VVKQPELPTSETEFINIFFKENLEQLDVYKLSFEDVPYKNQNDYAKICQKKIREIYLPSVNQLINNKYKDIKENDHVKKFIERLNTLKDVDSKRFLYKLTRIIEKHQLNI
ncbi:6381_t:CDS:1, partial [Dentiscutata erythropus]